MNLVGFSAEYVVGAAESDISFFNNCSRLRSFREPTSYNCALLGIGVLTSFEIAN